MDLQRIYWNEFFELINWISWLVYKQENALFKIKFGIESSHENFGSFQFVSKLKLW